MNETLLDYIRACPSPYHAVAHSAGLLAQAGFTPLCEGDAWTLTPGRGYYVSRNGSSLIAFRLPEGPAAGFMMSAAHGDSPTFKIKENAELREGAYVRLSVEKYGGMLCSTWLDRPLSVAGRVTVRTDSGLAVKLVDVGRPCALIPNVAIHMNRSANENASFNPAVDMLPLAGSGEEPFSLRSLAAQAAGVREEDILTTDLSLYNPEPGCLWSGFVSAPRLDDLQCAYAALRAFLDTVPGGSIPVCCLFDNEEVGSQTKQGAASTFLADVLSRVGDALGKSPEEQRRMIANSFLVSCDNAHAVHPNHGEYADKNHSVFMNKGVVIKYNASQRYTTDAVSAGLFRLLCEAVEVPCQSYANRADMAGGSTLGNIANTQVSLNTVDIGLAQLAMHSAYETAGARDTAYLLRALTLFFSKSLHMENDGQYALR